MPRYPLLRAHLFLPGARILHPRSTQTTRNNDTGEPSTVCVPRASPTYLPTYLPTYPPPTYGFALPAQSTTAHRSPLCVRACALLAIPSRFHRLPSSRSIPPTWSTFLSLSLSLSPSSFHRFFFLPLAPCLARVSPLATPIARDHAALARSLPALLSSTTRATQLYSPIYRC